jgi:Zn-dependent membrane protease YugP
MPFGFFEDEPTGMERLTNAATAAALGLVSQVTLTAPVAVKLRDDFGNLSDESLVKINRGDIRPKEEYYNPRHIATLLSRLTPFNDLDLADNVELKDLQKIMGTDVKVRVSPDILTDHSGPTLYGPLQGRDYDPRGYVNLSTSAGSGRPGFSDRAVSKAVALHELGHATANLPTASLGRRFLKKTMIPSKSLSGLSPLGAAFVDPNDKSEIATALGVQSLLHAPVLAEEFIASRKAFDGLDKLKALGRMSSSAVDESKDLLRTAYKTYAGGAAGSVLGTALALGLANDEIRSKLNPFD